MKQSNFIIKVTQSGYELNKIYRLRYKVFTCDEKLVSTNESNMLVDEWDNSSYQVCCQINDKIIACGRLIRYSPIGFRVSTSLDLNRYFDDLNNILEISALAVDENFRHLGLGNSIHYFRLKLASKLGANFVIASCFKDISQYLNDMGFQVINNRFHYINYLSGQPSLLLAFDLSKGSTSFVKLISYINEKCPTKVVRDIDNYIEAF